MLLLLSATKPPKPHLVSASNEINVTDDTRSKSLARSFEPAIRTISTSVFHWWILYYIARSESWNERVINLH